MGHTPWDIVVKRRDKRRERQRTRNEIIAERVADNLADVIEHGPHLSWNRKTWVIAKDPDAGMVYLGGLGCMGVGRMWTSDGLVDKDDPTYVDAPVWKCPGEMWL